MLSAFKKAGVKPAAHVAAQSKVGTPVRRHQLQPGDLVFFYCPVSHVGIYLGDGKIVHASTSGEPVKVSRHRGPSVPQRPPHLSYGQSGPARAQSFGLSNSRSSAWLNNASRSRLVNTSIGPSG